MTDFTPKTSSWFTRLPPDHLRVGISRGQPRGAPAGYRMYRKLQPGSWFKSTSPEEYKQLYFEILAKLDPHEVLDEILALAGTKVPVLACFEPPQPGTLWCHRGFVSAWFKDTIGLSVPELGFEKCGCGWSHPKVPPPFRVSDRVVVDRSADITPLVGKLFKHRGKPHKVIGVDPHNLDQALITDGKKSFPVSADLLLELTQG